MEANMDQNLSVRDAIKLGFLQRCLDDGLNANQIVALAEKTAAYLTKKAGLKEMARSWYYGHTPSHPDSTKKPNIAADPHVLAESHAKFQSDMRRLAIAGAVGIPTIGGAGLGFLGSKLQGDYLDPEDIHKQELINTYRTLAHRGSSQGSLGL
jgi:hypothetical protein